MPKQQIKRKQSEQKRETQANRENEQNLRMYLVLAGMLIFVATIISKLAFVQIINASEYREKAKRQYETIMPLKAKRGIIYDRNLRRLATSLTVVSFAADPKLIENKQAIADSLSLVFNKSAKYYFQRLNEKKRFVWLERNVSIDVAWKLISMDLTGIIVRKEQNRYYENLASQVIGFTNTDNQGISGIELNYDSVLCGKDGSIFMQRTGDGMVFPAVDKPLIDPIDGNSLQLTLDMNIQAIVESELKNGIRKAGAQAAIAIVMDVKTGEILAMANEPDFDMNAKSTYESTRVRNRAITDAYEPGSTFKIVMLSAATELGLYNPNDIVFGENGQYRIQGRTIYDHEKLGKITFAEAITHSSNIVAAKVALQIGEEAFYKYARDFGFGEKTGIDLLGEIPGQLKPREEWSKISLPWMAHGYEVLVTPLQIISAYAAVANDGILMRPFVIKREISQDGEVVNETEPIKIRRVMQAETAQKVRRYFRGVVDSGTGVPAQINGLEVGGKTGTAQRYVDGSYRRGSYVATFVGFFPVEKPEIAMLVMMINPTNGYYGSTVAAPVFSNIGRRVVATSEDIRSRMLASGESISDERHFLDSVQSVVVPNVCGLTPEEAKELLRVHKLDFSRENEQEGLVVWQGVAPGARASVWSKVPLRYSADSEHEYTMPKLIGLRADRAIALAGQMGMRIKIRGKGSRVVAQYPNSGATVDKSTECILRMSN
ncbi:Peptidoglycan glycosyltransferase [Chloroherpeton thalassium ATCC 35110]|uniref:Peptidoglycan glycosyltransferase n=1 Tax=Chloroherpeton thalassium (strain ATCC 35110 / GB-78) TaxID=517418 RepID=B3QWT1_CHLT3|nr:penicillin-binding transpeptidase domain-containing protein [Chloroherpeton thalassium]ACF13295.1 Peptidoglycan glycosyltransferase [Chloroherpeton thalassium ATCC 35110]